MGASSIGSASEVTHLTTAEAAAIRAEGIIRGTNGVFASTTVYSTYTANSVATLVPGLSGQVRITAQAASLFQPVKVVGPISAWTRIGGGLLRPVHEHQPRDGDSDTDRVLGSVACSGGRGIGAWAPTGHSKRAG